MDSAEEQNVNRSTDSNKMSRVFNHTGWHLDGDQTIYLHAGGALGPSGPVAGIRTRLDPGLDRYVLPDPPDGDDLREAVRASVSVLGVTAAPVGVALLAMVYRAPLGQIDFSGFLVGRTGVGKSELAALAQQHYGPGMDRLGLPASWMSTANALQAIAFRIKDALLVIDHFDPIDGHRMAERLLSRQHDAPARTRSDATRPPMPPRALILGTGEAIPRGESLRSHLLVLDVRPRDVSWGNLTFLQERAASGRFAVAMAGYLRWLAATYDHQADRVNARELRRPLLRGAVHPRTPDMIASLNLGLERFLEFAEDTGAISALKRLDIRGRAWDALFDLGEAQAADSPVGRKPVRRSGRFAGGPAT